MAESGARYSAVAAVLTGPLVASLAVYAAAQFVLDQIGSSTILVLSLVLSLVVTLFVGSLVQGILRKRNWVRWFHYLAASTIVATGVSIPFAVLIDDLPSLGLLVPWLVVLGAITAVVSWGILRPDRNGERNGRLWLGVAGASLAVSAGVIALNLDHLAFASAVLSAERRPTLLRDVEWNHPGSAHAFQQRFGPGTSEAALITWLQENRFVIDRRSANAHRLVQSLPCNEEIEIQWTRIRPAEIGAATVRISDAGCL